MASCLIIITWRVNWIWLLDPAGQAIRLCYRRTLRLWSSISTRKHPKNGWEIIDDDDDDSPIRIPKHRPGPRRQRFWTTSECERYKARKRRCRQTTTTATTVAGVADVAAVAGVAAVAVAAAVAANVAAVTLLVSRLCELRRATI